MKFEIVMNFEIDEKLVNEGLEYCDISLEGFLKDLERRYAEELEEEKEKIKGIKVVAKVIEGE